MVKQECMINSLDINEYIIQDHGQVSRYSMIQYYRSKTWCHITWKAMVPHGRDTVLWEAYIYPLSLIFFRLHTISPIHLLATITITPITHTHWHTPATPNIATQIQNLINSSSLSEKWSLNGLEIGRILIGILNRPRSTLVMGAIKFPRYIFTYVRLCIQYGVRVMTSVYPDS